MSTPHIEANKNEIANVVLMAGDPLRAKFIADTYLDNVRQVNRVRNMFAYTGTYKGKEVSVMGSGMGMPSIGIYSYELYTQYDVEVIIRVGTCGSYIKEAEVYDLILVSSAYSESSFAYVQNKEKRDILYPSVEVNNKLRDVATHLNYPLLEGCIHSTDVFYVDGPSDYYKQLRSEKGCIAVEMESFALFHNANVLNKKAACILSVSDNFETKSNVCSEDRELSLTKMMEVALGYIHE